MTNWQFITLIGTFVLSVYPRKGQVVEWRFFHGESPDLRLAVESKM